MYNSNASLPTSPSPVIPSPFYLSLEITLKFNSIEQKLNSLQKIHVSFREEFIISDSSFPEENYNSEEKKSGSRG